MPLSTPSTPSLAGLPPDLQKIIQDYVAKEVARLATEANLANAPKVLTPHEQLKDHHARAVAALAGDSSPIVQSMGAIHTLAALELLIAEVEKLTPQEAQVIEEAI